MKLDRNYLAYNLGYGLGYINWRLKVGFWATLFLLFICVDSCKMRKEIEETNKSLRILERQMDRINDNLEKIYFKT